LEKNKESIPKVDLNRYEKQLGYVKQIIKAYDEGSGPENDKKVVLLMQSVIFYHSFYSCALFVRFFFFF